MTDERLAEIRREWRSRIGIERQGSFAAQFVPDLLDEIARLGSVVDEYKEVIDLHHADFLKIKAVIAAASEPGFGFVAPQALQEIDGIVR